jgi:sigma-B regulation protein RsbU (phosphoserine phosphatase)
LGGDLYDWIAFDDGRLAITIGDVAGKGAPAALYGALASGVIRTRAGRKYPPAQMLELVGHPTFLDIGGIPLGLFPDSRYEETEIQLQPGDVLVFYSDGVAEMRNESGDEFGLRRLADVVRANHERPPDEIVKAVSAALADFIGRVRPNDDRTMIVVKMGR